jgi:hypothetical protein
MSTQIQAVKAAVVILALITLVLASFGLFAEFYYEEEAAKAIAVPLWEALIFSSLVTVATSGIVIIKK